MRRRQYGPRETPRDRMEKKLRKEHDHLWSIRLPEAEQYLAEHSDIKVWIDQQAERIDTAYVEDHEPAFDRGLRAYAQGWIRVNELVAELYAERVSAPTEWELRYVRWMKKIVSIVFESERWGEFAMYREMPRRQPEGRWFTVDHMIGMVSNPLTSAVLETFGTFPTRPELTPRPLKGENHLHIEFTASGMEMRTEFG